MDGVTTEELVLVIGVQTVELAKQRTQLQQMRAANLAMAEELQVAKSRVEELEKANKGVEAPAPNG